MSEFIISVLKTRNGKIHAAGILSWLVVVVAGMLVLIDYSSAPGTKSDTVARWPSDSGINRTEGRPTMVMFLHPRCPCSRASLNQLARLLTHCRPTVAVQLVFFCPVGVPETWAHTDLWDLANKLSSKPPMIDRGGREAMRFGAATSGHLFLFASHGERLYSGGITNGRGHEGDNLGCQAIVHLLNDVPVTRVDYPVFGCAMLAEEVAAND